MKVTLKDIAKRAGVSVNTVSRALRDKPDIGESRRKQIKGLAREMGYAPNVAAQSLVLRRSFTVGMVVAEFSNPVRTALTEIVRQICSEKGYQLLVSVSASTGNVAPAIRELAARGVDGLILGHVSGDLKDEATQKELGPLIASGMPIVGYHSVTSDEISRVNYSYEDAVCEMVNHLINEHGRLRIAFVGPGGSYPRRDGYVKALSDAGLTLPANVDSGDFSLKGGLESLESYLEEHPRPDALVCHNDLMAIGCMKALSMRGIAVPEEVSVVGVDAIEIGEYVTPPLTTVGTDQRRLCECLCDSLFQQVESKGKPEPNSISLACTVHYRSSCGCKY